MLGAARGPPAGDLAPHGIEATPGICAHFSQFTGIRAKQELAEERVDGRDVISPPSRPECRIPGQWLDRPVSVELLRDAAEQIIDLRHVITAACDQESRVPDLFAGHWPSLVTGPVRGYDFGDPAWYVSLECPHCKQQHDSCY